MVAAVYSSLGSMMNPLGLELKPGDEELVM
jgi:hypothetical protein